MAPGAVATAKKTPTLKALQVRLKSLQHMFTDICKFVESLDENTTAVQVAVRLEKLEDLWEKVTEVIIDIESHDDYKAEEDAFSKERSDFGTRYYDAKSALLERAKELEDDSVMNASARGLDTSHQPTSEHVRLPQIKLQTFDGNIDEWLSFRDLYTSLIHWKTDLPDVEKFHYLRGCLTGEAKALVDSLAITKANYTIAWDTLVRRYNDSKLLKRRQIEALFKLPNLAKESATELQTLLEGFERIVQILDQIVQPVDYKDLLLLHILSARLDPITRRGWEEYSAAREKDTVKDLAEFLQTRIRVLGSLPSKSTESKVEQSQVVRRKPPFTRTSHSAVQAPAGRCIACSEDHLLHQCPVFQRSTVSVRDKLIRNHSLCRNCFRRGHQATDCPSRYVCRYCKAKHHTMVCFRSERGEGSRSASESGRNQSADNRDGRRESVPRTGNSAAGQTVVSNMAAERTSSVLLATAVVLVEDDEGVSIPARALLDSGSECNFMTEQFSQKLHVRRRRSDVEVFGIGQANTRVRQKVETTIKSRVSGFSRRMEFLLLRKVTANLPTRDVGLRGWDIPNGVELADPAFFQSKAVDMVLGIQHFFAFFNTGNEIHLGDGLPSLTESVFGWVVTGTVESADVPPQITCNMAASIGLEELLTRFWSCEEVDSSNNYSPAESRCEEQYVRSVKRSADGRYTVALPKDEDALARMGESRDIAFRRLQGLERRLLKDSELRVQYAQFMAEYLELGHMRKVEAVSADTGKRYYMPHHPVVKQSSTTTKVRVVFDASCKTATGVSLNDTLLAGPVIQDDLRSIILRCRTRQIMLVSDVEKMFRQIDINPEDVPLQSILWRVDPKEEVETYELTTVTYGTKPAPFLATRTLNQLAMDEQARFPLAAKAVTEDVYMDDVLTGADEEDVAVELKQQLVSLTEAGGFRLRKWASNSPKVLQGIPEENLAIQRADGIQLDPDPAVRTLGLVWLPGTDVFKLQSQVPFPNPSEELSKRRVLSIIATLFDPLGLVGAVITTAKVFMQQLWCLKDEKGKNLDWDHPLPPTVGEEWQRFHEQLPQLNDLSVERCVIVPKATSVELHVFSDASQRAYGACVYVRSCDMGAIVRAALLTSKSKVAPLKSQSIPRLELCGALLAAQLVERVLQSLRIEVKVFCWTDSTCVLQWLKATPSMWTTFVANRVAKIQAISEHSQWQHVPGTQNPADLISRGVTPEQLKNNSLWWEGPSWLKEEPKCWPHLPSSVPTEVATEEVEKEVRRSTVHYAARRKDSFINSFINKFSTFTQLVRCTAYWLRFFKYLRRGENEKPSGFLTMAELREAEGTIVRIVQQEVFHDEWKAISRRQAVARSSPLRWFNPQLSEDNLIRVGGRLSHSKETESAKHPVVLPARHRLTRLILEHYHLQLLHAGPQLLLATVRLKFWPLGGRSVARNIVHKCQRCFRTKPTSVQQFMGELPAARVTVTRPFSRTGVDYFGPIYIRPGPRRTTIKAYAALFVCMCTKAVHLELVTDLSTDRFLQALRRFTARRGRCSDIYSDNGTNFVGARNQLLQLFELIHSNEHNERVARECTRDGIQWHFNPPSAPHFGGLWEAAVRSAKTHLLKVLGDNPVSYEDMHTLLAQVEACLNSRPLIAMSDDPTDLEPLTPGHFLIGTSLQQLPDPDYSEIPMNRLKQWQETQKRMQHFWKRWRTEYLAQLQGRTKRWRPAVPITVGKLVVIRDENTPPIRWKMGRILQVHPGDDGVVRVVTLKTATSVLKRPVEKICILPVYDGDAEDQPPEETSPAVSPSLCS